MSENYYFEDFTESNYKKILNLINNNYDTIPFTECKKSGKNLLLRHDVDFSVHRAYRLAQIESEVDIRSTFFLWMHSPAYNLFEEEICKIVHQIMDFKHEIGLHFDSGFYVRQGFDHNRTLEYLAVEKKILENMFGRSLTVFSFHDPSIEVLTQYTNESYCGMINTYSQYLKDHYDYCSDSNGYWRYRRLEDVLLKADSEKLQVLLHPEWWTPDVLPPRQRISRCIDGRCRRTHEWYDRLLDEMGRLNVR